MIDEVLFLRHGRTAYNLARRLQGQIDIPLDIVGRWQADQSAYELAKTYYWAKVAHLAEHNDQLAQPAYKGASRRRRRNQRRAGRGPPHGRRLVGLFRAQQTAHAFADLMGLDVELDPRLRERSFGEWEGMTREEICEHYADDYHSWRAHTGGETKHGVESRIHTGRRGAEAVRDIVAKHHDETMPTTLLLVGHGSWIVATVAVLLDMDPDDLNNVGAMRNAFWTRMTPHTDPRNADRPTWKLEEFNQGPAIASFADWRTVPNRCARPAYRCGSRSSNKHPIHGAENIIQSELLMESPPSVRQILTVGLSLMRLFARPCGEPGIRRSFRMRIGLPYSDRTLESAKGG